MVDVIKEEPKKSHIDANDEQRASVQSQFELKSESSQIPSKSLKSHHENNDSKKQEEVKKSVSRKSNDNTSDISKSSQ